MVSVARKFFRRQAANPAHSLCCTWLSGGRGLPWLWLFD